MTKLVLIIVVVSYLLGSIPFGYLLVWMFRGLDVRKTGSGNIGATNVARTGSKGLAIATLLLDALKGYAAVKFAFWLASSAAIRRPISASLYDRTPEVSTAARSFCWRRWRPSSRSWATCSPCGCASKAARESPLRLGFRRAGAAGDAGCARCCFVVVVALTRYVSLGSILAVRAFPLAVWWLSPAERTTAPILLLIAASSLLIIVRHKDNIRRLLAGTENRFR